tara:strand:- start:228 stop:557 length:330 start_codon:yes stop_codon:yes gene_type:complete
MTKKIFLLLVPFLLVLSGCSSSGDYDEFAQCLTENNIKMYGTEWCSHCQNQKAEFGDSFQYVDYVDCDQSQDQCLSAGIEGYPTWVISGEKYPGEQSLSYLSSLSGCEI